MSHQRLLPLCLTLAACTATRPPVPRAPAVEASWFKFPQELPEQGRQALPNFMVTAILLAMEDFLPREVQGSGEVGSMEACLTQPAAYDFVAFPGTEGMVFVSITLSPGACQMEGPLLDVGATYAVDVRGGRILAIQR